MKNKSKIILSISAIAFIVLSAVFINHKYHPFAVPQKTYLIQSDSKGKTYSVDKMNEYSFSIIDSNGQVVKDFVVTHTKLMHVIVVRKDLAYFQHLHPEFNQETGQFKFTNLLFPTDGEYRIFADFALNGSKKDEMGMPSSMTLSEDVVAGSMKKYNTKSIGSEETTKTFDGYSMNLRTHGIPVSGKENMLMFSISKNGKPVTNLEPYLGALGHSVILRENTLDFIHVHPMQDVKSKQTGEIDFMVDFLEAGKYKVFTQFQVASKVITSDFVVTVSSDSNNSIHDISEMHHD